MSFESSFVTALNQLTESSRPRQLRRDRIRAERPDRLTDAQRQQQLAADFIEAQSRQQPLGSSRLDGGLIYVVSTDRPVANQPPSTAIGLAFSPNVQALENSAQPMKHPARAQAAQRLYEKINELRRAGTLIITED